MHLSGDVVDRPAGMEIGGLAHGDALALRQHVVHAIAGMFDAALGLGIHRDPAFAARCGRTSARQGLDEVPHAGMAVAGDFGRPAHGSGDQPIIDDDEPQIVADETGFHQDAVGDLARRLDRGFRVLQIVDADGNAAALLATRRLHDHLAMGLDEGGDHRIVGGAGIDLLGHLHTGRLDDPTRHRLVVADRHGDGARQLRQALAAMDGAPALGEAEEAARRVRHLGMDAAPAGLVDDDAGIGVERVEFRAGTGEELLVDFVPALDREEGDPEEAQLVVEADGLVVVVHDRQIHIGAAACLKMFGEAPHQAFADAGMDGLGIDGEAPERGAVLRVVEGTGVVDARHRAEDRARRLVFRDEIGQRPIIPIGRQKGRMHLDHVARLIDPVDLGAVLVARQAADEIAARAPCAGPIGRQVQPIGVRGIEKELLGRMAQEDMGIGDVEGDVAPIRPFLAQGSNEGTRILKGLGEDEPAPAAVEKGVFARPAQGAPELGGRRGEPGRPLPAQAMLRAGFRTMAVVGHGVSKVLASAATFPEAPPATAPSRAGA